MRKPKRESKNDVKAVKIRAGDDSQDDAKKKYLAKRLIAALAAGLDLCECGGLIFVIDNYQYCGDCGNPRKYKE